VSTYAVGIILEKCHFTAL